MRHEWTDGNGLGGTYVVTPQLPYVMCRLPDGVNVQATNSAAIAREILRLAEELAGEKRLTAELNDLKNDCERERMRLAEEVERLKERLVQAEHVPGAVLEAVRTGAIALERARFVWSDDLSFEEVELAISDKRLIVGDGFAAWLARRKAAGSCGCYADGRAEGCSAALADVRRELLAGLLGPGAVVEAASVMARADLADLIDRICPERARVAALPSLYEQGAIAERERLRPLLEKLVRDVTILSGAFGFVEPASLAALRAGLGKE